MAKEVRWTFEAVSTFNAVISYLESDWTEKEITDFVNATDKVIEYISIHPEMFRKTNRKNIREALVTSQNLLIYKINGKYVDLLAFWDTRQNPRKKSSIVKR